MNKSIFRTLPLLAIFALLPALLVNGASSPAVAATKAAAATPSFVDAGGCGAAIKKKDGTAWTCTFSDNFTATTLDRTKWVPQTNFSSGNSKFYTCFADNPAVVSQSAGTLKLSVAKLATKVACPSGLANTNYASGQVSTYYKFSQKFGRFEVRAKTPVVNKTSLQETLWLWPDVRTESLYPTGEIDFMETYSEYPTLNVPYLHYDGSAPTPYTGSNPTKANTVYTCLAKRGEWNTYAVEWNATRLEIFVNGKSCMVNTSGSKAMQKNYIIALTQALGIQANSYADIDAGPRTTEIDYVRAWK